MTATRIEEDWLRDPLLQSVLAVLNEGEEEARIVGGPVRNTLLGQPVSDIDIATTCLPDEASRRIESSGFKVVPTGIEHGTITVIANGRPFEVTTLREDLSTDGRHAEVKFGRDWEADAWRRDFTINALYAKADGEIVDPVGGLADIEGRVLRFIGDAEARIKEDYLRILRFYRFFAWYGRGRPDAAGIRASAKLKAGLAHLSAERIWMELKKLLGAPDPSRALLWMRQAGVLTAVLPESERWGIDNIHPLIDTETQFGWSADPLLRLLAIIPPDAARIGELAGRLKLSKKERDRLLAYADAENPSAEESDGALRARLYFGDPTAIADRLKLALTLARQKEDLQVSSRLTAQLAVASGFAPPDFPLNGEDMLAAGYSPGPDLGKAMQRMKRLWAEGGFVMSREVLLDKAMSEDANR
ncbi:probable poly(A) polymerase [Fulvimarina pelagi HTCC2506]|uniref:Probable poly(A) polymerase n=2 Tax=Fulvimarina pelagi TaxID=217511 RepID=Q0G074_9HYPH|nr:CCA tRNA nucleotidyltransferase [Fulvimarina pelagi]EAU40719.1 probable poly(A) polymerase [Fulvimarina pelagi HTCC2506]BAT31261.1 probable poly(A) polymerase [Fulvimarina pelagi]